MSRATFEMLLEALKPKLISRKTYLAPIDAKTRLAVTLRFLGTGMSQTSLAFAFRVSQQSVSEILRQTMTAVIDTLKTEYLPQPSKQQPRQIASRFLKAWDFPNCCGALDGKHVRTKAPFKSGSLYHNYKSYFPTVLFARVDADYKFVEVDIGVPGSQSDSEILETSELGRIWTNGCLPEPTQIEGLTQPLPFVFLGDEGFGLKPWLMRPFGGDKLSPSEAIFNYRLSRARRVVENAFGILAARWSIYHTPIDADTDLVNLIILCSVILHNFLRVQNDDSAIQDEDTFIDYANYFSRVQHRGGRNNSVAAKEVRQLLCEYFTSDAESLADQGLYIMRGHE